jgi:hypothetical protein
LESNELVLELGSLPAPQAITNLREREIGQEDLNQKDLKIFVCILFSLYSRL